MESVYQIIESILDILEILYLKRVALSLKLHAFSFVCKISIMVKF